MGTDHIGRLDVVVDDDTNSVVEYKWQLIPIDENIAEPDKALSNYLDTYQQEVDQKYNAIICKLAVEHTHPQREMETSLGNLFADAFADNAECHVMFVASGSIRMPEAGAPRDDAGSPHLLPLRRRPHEVHGDRGATHPYISTHHAEG